MLRSVGVIALAVIVYASGHRQGKIDGELAGFTKSAGIFAGGIIRGAR